MHTRIILLTMMVIMMAGCGGSGIKPPLSGEQAGGIVTLPAGCSLRLADLSVLTTMGHTPVRTDGSFSSIQPTAGPAQVVVVDTNGRTVLLGYVDANNPNGGEISARETAVALIWDALATFAPPPEHWSELLAAIRADNHVSQLAAVIERRMVTNPGALHEGDPQIRTALAAAVAELAAMVPKSLTRASRQAGGMQAAMVSVAQDGGVALITDLAPTGRQSGLQLSQAQAPDRVKFTNFFRRHCLWHACRTAYEDAGGVRHELRPWESATPAGFLARYISATTGLDGVIGTLQGLLFGQIPYAPSVAEPFALTVSPTGARKTYYWICVIGINGEDWEGELLQLPRLPASEKAAIRTSMTFSSAVTSFNEFFLPLIFSVLPADSIEEMLKSKQFPMTAYDCVMFMAKHVPGIEAELAEGDVKGAVSKFVTAIRDSRDVREGVLKLLQSKGFLKKVNISSASIALARKAALVLQLVETVVQLFDAGTVVTDIGQSAALPQWTATAVSPAVSLKPDPATVSSGSRLRLTCQGVSDITGTKEYHWSTSGDFGHLEDGKGHSGNEFDSPEATIDYVANQGIKTDQSDTVSVVAHIQRGASRIKVGEAEATVNITPEPAGYRRANMRWIEWGPIVKKISKDWRATYYVANVASWEGHEEGTTAVIHYPEYPAPDDKVERYMSPDELLTRDELIEAFGSNVWGLGVDEVGFGVYGNSTSHETDTSAEDAIAYLMLRLPAWKAWYYSLEEYQRGSQYWVEVQ